MLEPRSIALVGASARPGSFGHRMVTEVGRSRPGLDVHLVNPRYAEIDGRPCVASLADLDDPVDLVLLGVPDSALEESARPRGRARATGRPSSSAVSWARRPAGGSLRAAVSVAGRRRRDGRLRRRLHGLRQRRARGACDRLRRGRPAAGRPDRPGLALGVGLLGPAAQPSPARLLPRVSRRGRSWSRPPRTTSVTRWTSPRPAWWRCCWRRCARPDRLRAALARAAEQGVPVVALTVGTSGPGAAMVAAHSGALAGCRWGLGGAVRRLRRAAGPRPG